jgi:hypothetical protein
VSTAEIMRIYFSHVQHMLVDKHYLKSHSCLGKCVKVYSNLHESLRRFGEQSGL